MYWTITLTQFKNIIAVISYDQRCKVLIRQELPLTEGATFSVFRDFLEKAQTIRADLTLRKIHYKAVV